MSHFTQDLARADYRHLTDAFSNGSAFSQIRMEHLIALHLAEGYYDLEQVQFIVGSVPNPVSGAPAVAYDFACTVCAISSQQYGVTLTLDQIASASLLALAAVTNS